MVDLISVLLICFGTLYTVMFLYSINAKNKSSMSSSFAILCLSAAIYIIGYALELRSDSLEEIRMYIELEYFGLPFVSAFWLFFSYRFKNNKSVSGRTAVIFLVIPMLTLLFSVTNEYHGLIYTNIEAVDYNGNMRAVLTKGVWYYIYIIYAYFSQLYGMFIFAQIWSNGSPIKSKQAKIMLFGAIWPGAANLIYIVGLSPEHIDLTPFGICITGIAFYIAVFGYGFLNMRNIVREITFDEIQEGIIVTDDQRRLVDYNVTAGKIYEWLSLKNIGEKIIGFPGGTEIIAIEKDEFELLQAIEGTERLFQFKRRILRDRKRIIGYVFFIRDITLQNEIMRRLKEIANYDSLTGIYNRRKIMLEAESELKRSLRYGHFFSVLMIDIDHFKIVNDSFGHQCGDEVLKGFAAEISGRLRKTDIIGRYGGEEFLVILTETNHKMAVAVAEEIRKNVEEMRIVYNEQVVSITVSIGIRSVDFSISGETGIDEIIIAADKALYISKEKGRNRITVYRDE